MTAISNPQLHPLINKRRVTVKLILPLPDQRVVLPY